MSAASIDFLRRQKIGWGGWLLLAIGVSALLAAVWLNHRWTRQRDEYGARLKLREEAAQESKRAALQAIVPTPDQLRLQRIAPQLRQPWLPVLRLIENATEAPVFLLAVAIDPATGAMRLDAEAPSFEQALAYSQALDRVGVTGPAQVRSHELFNEPDTGNSLVRFSIVTRWKTR